MSKLSVIIITKDSQRTMRACLESVVGIASEIIVIDSGSTDQTLEICAEFTDCVFSMDWPGYGIQKQRALDKATCQWVLSLDSDEVVTEQLADEIRKSIASDVYDAYTIAERLMFCGKLLNSSVGNKHKLILCKRSSAHFSECMVHEKLIINGNVGHLKSYFIHYSYSDISDWLSKMNAYSSLQVEEKIKRSSKSSLTKAIVSGIVTFIKFYFFKRAFLEGRIGFIFSFNAAISNYYKYLKLYIKTTFS